MRWAGHVARMGTGVNNVLVRKPEGKRLLGKPRRRWQDYIKTDLQEVGCGGIGLDRCCSGCREVAGTCECGNVTSGPIKCGEFFI